MKNKNNLTYDSDDLKLPDDVNKRWTKMRKIDVKPRDD